MKKIYNSTIFALLFSIILNSIMFYVIYLLEHYKNINIKFFLFTIMLILAILFLLNIFFLLGYAKKIRVMRKVYSFFSVILIVSMSVLAFYFYRGDNLLKEMINYREQEQVNYTLYSKDKIDLNALSFERVAYVPDEEGMLKKNVHKDLFKYSKNLHYLEYDNFNQLMQGLETDDFELILIPKGYEKLISDSDREKISSWAPIQHYEFLQTEQSSDVDVLKKPFTVLLLGNNEGLSDSIMLLSYNPFTYRMTMTSLSRDSFVPIACYSNQGLDKLNHARAQSRQCLVDTVEELLNVDIDFYFETDFYAIVKIVDALGGLEIESPVNFSGTLPIEDSLNETENITVPEGKNLLNGKQVITFARERHHMPNGDFDRQANQQYVIKELAQKIMATRNLETMMSLLDVASSNIVTNLSIKDISALMGHALDVINHSPLEGLENFIIVQSQVSGTTPIVSGMSVVYPYLEDIETASSLINDNMKPLSHNCDKTYFYFSYEYPFQEIYLDPDSAGNHYKAVMYDNYYFEIPNFTLMTMEDISDWGGQNNVEINWVTRSYHKIFPDNVIYSQYPSAGIYTNRYNNVEVYLIGEGD